MVKRLHRLGHQHGRQAFRDGTVVPFEGSNVDASGIIACFVLQGFCSTSHVRLYIPRGSGVNVFVSGYR